MDDLLLDEFERRLDEIALYWKHLSLAAKHREQDVVLPALSGASAQAMRDERMTPGLRKVFDYASVVIALYGAIESYVERLVEHCILVIGKSVKRYSELSLSLRKHHERLSLRLADQIAQNSYRGYLSLQTVIDNLAGCLADRRPFLLNAEAFAIHGANIRLSVLREMFARLSLDQIGQDVEAHHLVGTLMADLGREPKEIFYYLDDLAQRRNVVAHGERPQDVISAAMMPEYLRALRAFGVALFESALLGMMRISAPTRLTSLGRPTGVYKSGRVPCFEADGPLSLKVGDRLLWRSGGKWSTARVGSLQIDRVALQAINCEAGVRYGVGISVRAHVEQEYLLIEQW